VVSWEGSRRRNDLAGQTHRKKPGKEERARLRTSWLCTYHERKAQNRKTDGLTLIGGRKREKS